MFQRASSGTIQRFGIAHPVTLSPVPTETQPRNCTAFQQGCFLPGLSLSLFQWHICPIGSSKHILTVGRESVSELGFRIHPVSLQLGQDLQIFIPFEKDAPTTQRPWKCALWGWVSKGGNLAALATGGRNPEQSLRIGLVSPESSLY